jgi:hypothetical protein
MKEQRIQPGINLLGFETTEEMMGYLREQEERAITRTRPEQWTITWGDYVVRVVDGLIIFGRIFTEEEYLTESEVLSPGEDPAEVLEEVRYEMERLRDSFRRGYRYGRYYSEAAPDGEYGSAHVSTLWKISEEDFAVAKDSNWKPPEEFTRRMVQVLDEAYQHMETHGKEEE